MWTLYLKVFLPSLLSTFVIWHTRLCWLRMLLSHFSHCLYFSSLTNGWYWGHVFLSAIPQKDPYEDQQWSLHSDHQIHHHLISPSLKKQALVFWLSHHVGWSPCHCQHLPRWFLDAVTEQSLSTRLAMPPFLPGPSQCITEINCHPEASKRTSGLGSA